MNQAPRIITPIPKFVSAPQIDSDVKSTAQDKVTQGQERNTNIVSIKSTGFSLSGISTARRNSAFSIYSHNAEEQDIKNEQQDEQFSSSSKSVGQHRKRTWKRQKKDKRELSRLQTKNLNRYFRSKINQMLRDIKENPKHQNELKRAEELLELLNKSNKIMFSEIREIIKDEWLQKKLLSCSGMLLKYIHGGKMGMQSKLIMLKYFNKILKAIRNPDNFTCWK